MRPHIEFIQGQALPWTAGLYAAGLPGLESKTLSHDPETGAASVLVRYPAGWRQRDQVHLAADEELFVLDGALEINGRAYGEFAYAHLPAGYARASASSAAGAVVLTFFSAVPEVRTGSVPKGLFEHRRLVEYVDGLNQPYDNDFARMGSEGVNANGIALKLLREDAVSREQTWLLGAVANWPGAAVEIHPVVEEMYLISGEIVGERGSMKAGAYFWRPPGERHGPFATRQPSLHFFRSKGGPLSTVFEEPAEPFRWDSAYRPVLPPELAPHARAPWQGAAARY